MQVGFQMTYSVFADICRLDGPLHSANVLNADLDGGDSLSKEDA